MDVAAERSNCPFSGGEFFLCLLLRASLSLSLLGIVIRCGVLCVYLISYTYAVLPLFVDLYLLLVLKILSYFLFTYFLFSIFLFSSSETLIRYRANLILSSSCHNCTSLFFIFLSLCTTFWVFSSAFPFMDSFFTCV